MSLKSLTNAEMAKHGGDLLERGEGTPRARMEALPAVAGLIPGLERAQRELIASQPAGNAEIAKLTELLAELDARHDDLCRGIDQRLTSEAALAVDASAKQAFLDARGVIFPSGMTIVGRSYTEEAGEAKLREARVGAQVRRTLDGLQCADDTTLGGHFDALQRVGGDIGVAESRRAALGAEGATVLKNGAARNQWIRSINAIAAVLASEGIDEGAILGAIRAAEALADARRDGQAPAPTDPRPAPTDPTPLSS